MGQKHFKGSLRFRMQLLMGQQARCCNQKDEALYNLKKFYIYFKNYLFIYNFSCAVSLWLYASRGDSRHSGFSSCSMQALEQGLLPLGMCDLPGPGMDPVSPALQGRLLTTGLPGKPGGTL